MPQRGGLGGAAEVDERDGAVVERVGGAWPTLRLRRGYGRPATCLPGRPQDRGHLREVVGTILRPLAEAAGEDDRRRARGKAARCPGDGGEHLGRREAVLPRAPPSEGLEHRQAEAPQVRPAAEGVARGLLGREVGRRPAAAALDRHVCPAAAPAVTGAGTAGRAGAPCEAEVGDLGQPVRREHDVRGLDVAVHEPLLVGVVQPPRELDRDVEDGLDGGRGAARGSRRGGSRRPRTRRRRAAGRRPGARSGR